MTEQQELKPWSQEVKVKEYFDMIKLSKAINRQVLIDAITKTTPVIRDTTVCFVIEHNGEDLCHLSSEAIFELFPHEDWPDYILDKEIGRNSRFITLILRQRDTTASKCLQRKD
jgi:hypothetical protein